ncbi:MAG: hypothetical protein LBC28_06075, partial [Oscillospiraceae bacterium]|nr:hypothetical protein [Oscillospiraceae bacterium]
MAIDGKLLARAREALAERRAARESLRRRRENEVFARSPRTRELAAESARVMRGLFALALSHDAKAEDASEIAARGVRLREELGRECLALGLPENYLDD